MYYIRNSTERLKLKDVLSLTLSAIIKLSFKKNNFMDRKEFYLAFATILNLKFILLFSFQYTKYGRWLCDSPRIRVEKLRYQVRMKFVRVTFEIL